MKKDPTVIMTFENATTFGGSVTSLHHLLKAINKLTVRPIVVSGQPVEYLHEEFSDYTYYHFVPRNPWIDKKVYLRVKSTWPFSRYRFLAKCLAGIRYFYWILFIQGPEAIKYVRLAKMHNVQVFHFNNWLSIPWIIAAKVRGKPSVGHLRGFVPSSDLVLRFLARQVDHHVAVSTAIRHNLLQLGISIDRITLVHDAIDMEEFRQDINCEHLRREFGLSLESLAYGLFGRVVPWKGIREFIHAAREISRMIPNAVGFIVGDFSDGDQDFFEEMQRLAIDQGLAGKLVFTGYRKDVVEMIALMDVIVHASIEPEPFGMGIIEGMAMGKPVVATRSGGPLDIVEEGETGYLVGMKDSAALASAVSQLLNTRLLRESMGKKGRARVEKYFHNKLAADKMEKLFLQLASSPKRLF